MSQTVLAGTLHAWGRNDDGQCNVPAGDDFAAIAGGGSHSLALRDDGSLAAWGANPWGQCNVPAGDDFVAVSAGAFHSLALKENGALAAWGFNAQGQCNVPSGNDFVAISAGGWHNLALKSDGSVVAWGSNGDGECNVPPGYDFAAVGGGGYHSLALKTDGSLAAWGYNAQGQSNVPAGYNFASIAAGHAHNLALRTDGSLLGWGWNNDGQCNVPVGSDFAAIAAGGGHSLALKTDGALVGWGRNTYGETSVPAGNDFAAIAGGAWHSLALEGAPAPPPPPPAFHALIVGVDYPGRPLPVRVNYHPTAEAFRDALEALVGPGGRDEIVYRPLTDALPDQMAQIEGLLAYFQTKVRPGDSFLFYFAGHGDSYPSGHERPVQYLLRYLDQGGWSTGNEAIGIDGSDLLTDNDLTRLLSGDAWSDVKKMVILDACHSGGFWGEENPDDLDGDLENLTNIALLAAVPENGVSYYDFVKDEGVFSMVLVDGMSSDENGNPKADTDGDGRLTFDELFQWTKKFDWAGLVQQEGDNLVVGDMFDFSGQHIDPVAYDPLYSSSVSSDLYIPEPVALSLLALGGLVLIPGRRK